MTMDGWFDGSPVLGRMSPEAAATKLRELGEDDAAAAIESAAAPEGGGRAFGADFWPFGEKPWQYTAHAFGYLPPTQAGGQPVPIVHAGNIEPAMDLVESRIKITLDRLRVADYPGGGTHLVLFDFYAQNQIETQTEHLHYNAAVRAMEGQEAGLINHPIFVGLSVGNQGVGFRCRTVNVKNLEDEGLLAFLNGEAFQAGLRLATTVQPAIGPLSSMAFNLVNVIQDHYRNVAVQDFQMGLDFSRNAFGARLAEGNYVVVQIPSKMTVMWDWEEWAYYPGSGQIASVADRSQLIPYNYLVFGISRFRE